MPSPPRPPTQPALSGKTPFIQRLGYYLLGLAIGLMMVGMIISMRSRAMSQQSPGTPAPPPPASPR